MRRERWRLPAPGSPPSPTGSLNRAYFTAEATMDRRSFLSLAGACLTTLRPGAAALVEAAAQRVAGRPPEEVAIDEDFWFQVRHAFTIDRNHINLNSGSVSPAPVSV